jgi:hypothetical protein
MKVEATEAGILTVAQENAITSIWKLLKDFNVKIK